jgi:hypothetical protein
VPNGRFVYSFFKSLIIKLVFCKYAQILYCLRTRFCFKSLIVFYVHPKTHDSSAQIMRKSIFSRYDSRYVKSPKIADLGEFLYSASRVRGRDSSVGIATGYGLDGPEIRSRWERDFSHTSRLALGPTQPPVQWVPGLSRG